MFVFFFQAEDGIRDTSVTGVQTCALPIFQRPESEIAVQVLFEGGFEVGVGLMSLGEAGESGTKGQENKEKGTLFHEGSYFRRIGGGFKVEVRALVNEEIRMAQ